ncbi:MAG: hypothetical protein M3R27_09815 [Bacteroidota bacterium]|nr:hypothetical protein [Bacteroidota bacterium]
MKNSTMVRNLTLGAALLCSSLLMAQKKPDPKSKYLEGKKYNVQFYEMKASGRGKAVPTMVVIKSGQIMCDLMEDKLILPPVKYKVTLDSTYTEDETEMRMISFEAEYAEEKNEYKWEATVINYDIEGTCVQMKSGVEKKRFEFAGSEKVKK